MVNTNFEDANNVINQLMLVYTKIDKLKEDAGSIPALYYNPMMENLETQKQYLRSQFFNTPYLAHA